MIVIENRNVIECECPRCRSRLGVHEGDIHHDDIGHRMPEFSASCGACGATVSIPRASIPSDWIFRIVPREY